MSHPDSTDSGADRLKWYPPLWSGARAGSGVLAARGNHRRSATARPYSTDARESQKVHTADTANSPTTSSDDWRFAANSGISPTQATCDGSQRVQ
jgi:hypothetical protein